MKRLTYEGLISAMCEVESMYETPSGILIHPDDQFSLIQDVVPEEYRENFNQLNGIQGFDVYTSDRIERGTVKFIY